MIWNAMLPITNCCTGALNMITASKETGMSPDEQTPLVQALNACGSYREQLAGSGVRLRKTQLNKRYAEPAATSAVRASCVLIMP